MIPGYDITPKYEEILEPHRVGKGMLVYDRSIYDTTLSDIGQKLYRALLGLEKAINRYNSVTNPPAAVFLSRSDLIVVDSFDIFSGIDNTQEFLALFHYENFIPLVLARIVKATKFFKRLTIEIIRLKFIANIIRNRISRSPTPQKKEPPVGGVKIGGELFGNHVAEELYQISF